MSSPVTVISGTRKGIGRYLAEHYLAMGHRVAGFSRKPSDLNNPNYLHFEADVRDETAAVNSIRQIAKTWGRIDHLINNAAIAGMNHFLLTESKSMREMFSTNLEAPIILCRETARWIKAQEHGRIVNLTSVNVPLVQEGHSIYGVSKAGIEFLTKVLARELAPFKITVNAVGPNSVDTNLIQSLPDSMVDSSIQKQAIKRKGELADVANVIDFFLSEKSDLVTGQILYLGGV